MALMMSQGGARHSVRAGLDSLHRQRARSDAPYQVHTETVHARELVVN